MKDPVIHVATSEEMARYVIALQDIPQINNGYSLRDNAERCRVYRWPEGGRDLYVTRNYFDTLRPPAGTTHKHMIRVNSLDQLKRYLKTFLA